MKTTLYFVSCVLYLMLFLLYGCGEEQESRIVIHAPADTSDSSATGNTIYLTDRTGTRWDITHAIEKYGMNPDYFRFGLGPDAIQPINNPEFIVSGEEGFPPASGSFRVIGINFNGDRRAYPLGILSSHEVVNDHSGSIWFAVVY